MSNTANGSSSDWISVEDKLPQPEQPVLISRRKTHVFPGPNHKILVYAVTDCGAWYDFQCNELEDEALWEITHWMPLPEPPREQDDD